MSSTLLLCSTGAGWRRGKLLPRRFDHKQKTNRMILLVFCLCA